MQWPRIWFLNRVVLGLATFFVLIGFWEFRWKPQYRGPYEEGVRYYQAGNYKDALIALDKAYKIAPNAVDVILMEGWVNLKLNRYEEARVYFHRVLRIDPRVEEAQMGAAFVAMETGRGVIDYKALAQYLGKRATDPNVAILIAGAFVQDGKNRDAAEIYERLMDDKNYGFAARLALQEMLGLESLSRPVQFEFARSERPEQLQVAYRAGQGSMWRLVNGAWQKYYITGVNLGPGSPGHYPAHPPMDGNKYLDWIRKAEQMNANTLRVYTLLPPSFYRAFKKHKQEGGKITLYQQIWVGDPPNRDLYDPKFFNEVKAEIRHVVDAIHGKGDVPQKHARGSGIYTEDIGGDVAAILLGREMEASVAIQTNVMNAGKQGFDGKYISIAGASATEVWFAEMLDYLVEYETDTYNWQHPVAIVNWPPLDPLFHKTETPNFDEVKFRIRHGEKLEMPKGIDDDNDAVSIDEAKYKVKPALFAGLFASYHVYPYYPDFLILDRKYLSDRDSRGLNPMFGYVKELRERIPHPLLITEYGIPNSIGISHFHPYGWHHGGHGEVEQAKIVRQLSSSIREAGCAGGIVFSLIDEWYKHNWLTVDFENPLDRAALWMNELDPEKRYGMVGFRSRKERLFLDEGAWAKESTLYADRAGNIRKVQAAVDEAFVYLRIEGACVRCGGKKAYALALSTIPGGAGFRQIPFATPVSIVPGANFLLYLPPAGDGKLYIAQNYNPYQLLPRPGAPNETELSYKRAAGTGLEHRGEFQELIVETNRRRFGRDGTLYPLQRYSRSDLRFGGAQPDPSDTMVEWYSSPRNRTIMVRIPWGKLLITDPSSRRAFLNFSSAAEAHTMFTPGVDVSVFELEEGGRSGDFRMASITAAHPAGRGGTITEPARITWENWDKVAPDPYLKKAFYALQEEFLEQNRGTNAPAVSSGGGVVAGQSGTSQTKTR